MKMLWGLFSLFVDYRLCTFPGLDSKKQHFYQEADMKSQNIDVIIYSEFSS